jgi:hypothetical protein
VSTAEICARFLLNERESVESEKPLKRLMLIFLRNHRPKAGVNEKGIARALDYARSRIVLEGGSPWDLSLTPAFKAGEASEEWTLAVSTAYDRIRMSVHSYSRCWLHLIWGTLNREKLLNKAAAARVSGYLTEHAEKDRICMKINYVNADHVHALIDLPTTSQSRR